MDRIHRCLPRMEVEFERVALCKEEQVLGVCFRGTEQKMSASGRGSAIAREFQAGPLEPQLCSQLILGTSLREEVLYFWMGALGSSPPL